MMKLLASMFALVVAGSPLIAQEPRQDSTSQEPARPAPGADRVPDRAQLEKQFEKTMTGATLVGHFTVDGRGGGRGAAEPKEERYTIQRVTKQQGDTWLFLARIQFGGRDVTIPMFIPVKWAGDTAVISVTDMGFPGLGTYTARVVVYRDQYAGTWSGKDHGGHLWGRIERAGESPKGEGNESGSAGRDEPAKPPQ